MATIHMMKTEKPFFDSVPLTRKFTYGWEFVAVRKLACLLGRLGLQ